MEYSTRLSSNMQAVHIYRGGRMAARSLPPPRISPAGTLSAACRLQSTVHFPLFTANCLLSAANPEIVRILM